MGPIGCDGQTLPHGVWNLNPRVYATMTAGGGAILCWCSKSQKRNEVASPHPHRTAQQAETSQRDGDQRYSRRAKSTLERCT